MEIKRSCGFCRIFTVAFLLFLGLGKGNLAGLKPPAGVRKKKKQPLSYFLCSTDTFRKTALIILSKNVLKNILQNIKHRYNIETETDANFDPSLVKEEIIEPDTDPDFIIEEGT